MGRIFAFIYGLAAYFIGTILYAIGFVAGRRALARDNRLQKERAQLHVHALPDHLLRDIGVSRCEIAGLRAVGPSGRRRHRRREAMHAEIKGARRRSASENPRRPVAAPGHDPEKLTDFSDKITRKNKRLERDDESTKVIPLEARAASMTPTANFWETKIASELPILRWRTSPRRVRRRAVELIENHGEVAFFRAHEFAWAAQGQAKHYEAKFWQAVSREIGRQIQRQHIIAFISSAAS